MIHHDGIQHGAVAYHQLHKIALSKEPFQQFKGALIVTGYIDNFIGPVIRARNEHHTIIAIAAGKQHPHRPIGSGYILIQQFDTLLTDTRRIDGLRCYVLGFHWCFTCRNAGTRCSRAGD